MNASDRGFTGAIGFGRGHGGFMGGMGNIEVSSEYTANVNTILINDTDMQNLISQDYNVTSIDKTHQKADMQPKNNAIRRESLTAIPHFHLSCLC